MRFNIPTLRSIGRHTLNNLQCWHPSKNHFFIDLDGVLCDGELISKRAHQYALRYILNKYKVEQNIFNASFFKLNIQGLSFENALNNIIVNYPIINKHKNEYSELSTQRFLTLKKQLGKKYLIENSCLFLNHLLTMKFQVCIVSASKQSEILDVLKLMEFDNTMVSIIGIEDYQFLKPNPQPYLIAAKELGVKPSVNCIVIEDSIVGIRAAKLAGMTVVALTTTCSANDLSSEKPDWIVNDLIELIYLLKDKNPNSFSPKC